MTLQEAIAQQPQWLTWWLNWLLFGAFALPFVLLIWRQTRIAAVAAIVTAVAGGLAVNWMYGMLGYVKLLGLPHILLWTPLAIYLIVLVRRDDMAPWPRRVVMVVLVTILISLAFDYTDVARYLFGERTPLAMPARA